MDEIEAVEIRALEIVNELGVTYEMALMLAMSERGEFAGDLIVVDEDGNESEPELTPME